ncbi:hypothetical protein Tsp_11775 [Trichinella spiralis]|uniref:hypothetical protein n=1 Tax=Trichinella spiralis TaxID=6334 RepID=UPI0001EFEC25|nr:hypothetical protein Tsp_11775 [Trichinella spiralis]
MWNNRPRQNASTTELVVSRSLNAMKTLLINNKMSSTVSFVANSYALWIGGGKLGSKLDDHWLEKGRGKKQITVNPPPPPSPRGNRSPKMEKLQTKGQKAVNRNEDNDNQIVHARVSKQRPIAICSPGHAFERLLLFTSRPPGCCLLYNLHRACVDL